MIEEIIYFQQDGTIILECTNNIVTNYYAYFKLTPNGQLSRNEEKDYGGKSNITDIYPLNSNYLLVEYGNQGKIFLWNGTLVQSDIELGTGYKCIINDIQNDKFLIWKQNDNITEIGWTIYNIPTESNQNEALDMHIFVNNSPISDSPSINITRYSVYVTFWEPETTDFSPHFLLDQYDAIDLSIGCAAQIDDLGYFCLLMITTMESVHGEIRGFTISFLKSGAVLKYDTIYKSGPDGRFSWENPLPYGGKITQTQKLSDPYQFTLSDQFGKQKDSWNTSSDGSAFNAWGILPNNTFLTATLGKNNITIYSKNLPHFLKNDTGYENPLIEITYPRLNTIIPLGWREINITYSNEISLSNNNNNNISIYQINETIPILRQSISGKNCRVDSDKKTIIAETVLESTFNQPDKDYFIVVDNNFVKDAKYKEAIKGINGREKSKHAATLTGLLRLNTNGTSNFTESRNSSGFFETLEDQLALTIPVERHRIEIINHKTDKSVSAGHKILQLKISSVKDKLERNPMEIANDLDIMVKNKWLTPISVYSHTGFLDETYGFQVKPNLWEENKLKLIAIAIIAVTLMALYFIGRKKNPEGKNFIFVSITLILIDVVVDIIFVINNGKDVRDLYLPSILFLVLPFLFNSGLAAYIVITEITINDEYVLWLRKHAKPAALFTLLSSADIDALNLLYSKYANFDIFNAPISNRVDNLIFWGSGINIFIEDVPQFIIQVFYHRNTFAYNIIPLISLTMSSIILSMNLICRIYGVFIWLRVQKKWSPVKPQEMNELNSK
ncbi:hypothetical protein G9A89_015397 [Geosiphon pyriformis]|nr:hypothetical protein G9A89_015397 [Geosiphon pyriformis]